MKSGGDDATWMAPLIRFFRLSRVFSHLARLVDARIQFTVLKVPDNCVKEVGDKPTSLPYLPRMAGLGYLMATLVASNPSLSGSYNIRIVCAYIRFLASLTSASSTGSNVAIFIYFSRSRIHDGIIHMKAFSLSSSRFNGFERSLTVVLNRRLLRSEVGKYIRIWEFRYFVFCCSLFERSLMEEKSLGDISLRNEIDRFDVNFRSRINDPQVKWFRCMTGWFDCETSY